MQQLLVRHLNKSGSSILEIMVMIAVLGMAVVSIFSTVSSGINFAKESENRIKAIALAREGIEGVTNLRNTNWLRFSSDRYNCWRAKDYKSTCIGGFNSDQAIADGNYILNNENGAWYLRPLNGVSATNSGLWIDTRGFYSWTGNVDIPRCTLEKTTECLSLFTRQITILGPPSQINTNSGLIVRSIVEWNEKKPQKVILEATLTNWKSKF